MIGPQALIDEIKKYNPNADEEPIRKAYIFALDHHGTQIRDSGDPYFSHPLEVASILTQLKMDPKTVISGLLHDTVEDTDATLDSIEELFGEDIAKIVDGVTKLSKFEMSSIAEKQTENFKKLLLSAASDIRVLIIKLADRLHNMRTLKYKSKEKRISTAKETIEIYAPLAERIGMSRIKDELQDIAFMELYPDIYNSIKTRLKTLYESSEHLVGSIAEKLKELADSVSIPCSINGRLKTPYSIWVKMNKRSISFEQLSDIMAFRVIVDTIPQCYQILGSIHKNYLVVPGRFRDYISTPKSNGYQSIHTSVIGPLNKRIEIQIRTKNMHAISEYGVAAHWQYKDSYSGKQKHDISSNYQWLRNLVEILENTSGIEEFLENSKAEMASNQVFCITPKGRLVSLPRDATVLDFAYAIHSEVGNHAVGAKVNGRSVPLKTVIDNGDQVEIETDPKSMPKYYWENHVVTIKAKNAIRKVLNSMEKEKCIVVGKTNIDEIFNKYSIKVTEEEILHLTKTLSYENINQLFAAVGSSEITTHEILSAYNKIKKSDALLQYKEKPENSVKITDSLPISGLPDAPIMPVNCCTPVPGDRICGLLFEKRGIEIHLENCKVLLDQSICSTAKIIELSWNKSAFNRSSKYITRLEITFDYAPGNLSKIADIMEQKEASIINLKIGEKFDNFVQLMVEIEVMDIAHLSIITATLRSCDFVTNVKRT